MKVQSGHIPEELTYVIKHPLKVCHGWDDVILEDGEKIPEVEVLPVFVSGSKNAKTLATGRQWAKVWDPQKGKLPAEVTRKNEPFAGIKVMGLDVRGNGGRAWKCLSKEGYYFDLREDILLDVMRNVGVAPGGILNGEYIWARIGAEMKLIRVGSEIHTAVVASTARRDTPTLSAKELKPWTLYQQKNGDVWLHVGFARGWKPDKKSYTEHECGPAFKRLQMWSNATERNSFYELEDYKHKYGNDLSRPPSPPRLDIKSGPYREHLWVPATAWNPKVGINSQAKNLASDIAAAIQDRDIYSQKLNLRLGTDMKVINEIGEFKVSGDVFSKIRKTAIKAYMKQTSEIGLWARQQGHKRDRVLEERRRLRIAASFMKWGTIYEDNGTPHESHEDWGIWILSKEPK